MPEETIAGRYRLIELLGKGGMGSVHRVVDTWDGRELALKRLLLRQTSERHVGRELFEREYHTLSELAHPRIIEVYDYGVDEEGAYYTMELLDRQRSARARPDATGATACALLRDSRPRSRSCIRGGSIHRDLSPRNVRCTADGRAKLLDFGAMMPMGVAEARGGHAAVHRAGDAALRSLDGRTDLYGLGALGYLAAHRPARLSGALLRSCANAGARRRARRSSFAPEIPHALSRPGDGTAAARPHARARARPASSWSGCARSRRCRSRSSTTSPRRT